MRLSYLDILLSTTAIFVVLFGVLSVGESLPEVEGKSLTMLIVAERPAGKPLAIEVDYLDMHGRTLGRLPRPGSNAKELYQIKLDDSQIAKGILVIRGQPEMKSKLRVSAKVTMDLDEYQKVLVDCGKVGMESRLDPIDRELLDWIRSGERLAFSSTTAPDSRPQMLKDWEARCPASRIDSMWEELRCLASDRNVRLAKSSRIDLLAYALIVHDGIMPDTERKIKELPPENRLLRRAFFRASRHLERTWGETIALHQRVPDWCREPEDLATDETGLPANRRANVRLPDWADRWVRKSPEGGTFFIEDCISTDVLKPFRVFWSYAGHNGCQASVWKSDASAPGVLIAQWEVSFD